MPVDSPTSQYNCPACPSDAPLIASTFGQQSVALLECQQCNGLWIPIEQLLALMEFGVAQSDASSQRTTCDYTPQNGRVYRLCAVCRDPMVRHNCGEEKSKIIVDICSQHGVWFDDSELPSFLAWVQSSGAAKVRQDLVRLKQAASQVALRGYAEFTEQQSADMRKRIAGPYCFAEDIRGSTSSTPAERIAKRLLVILYDRMLRG